MGAVMVVVCMAAMFFGGGMMMRHKGQADHQQHVESAVKTNTADKVCH